MHRSSHVDLCNLQNGNASRHRHALTSTGRAVAWGVSSDGTRALGALILPAKAGREETTPTGAERRANMLVNLVRQSRRGRAGACMQVICKQGIESEGTAGSPR